MTSSGVEENKRLNTLIVDDDSQSRKLLSILLKKFPQINVVGEASSISGALGLIKEKKPDSIFLDICLGTNNGFELMEKISKEAKVVFVSAYDDYAIRAFEVNALDYLKKPVDYNRLALTIDRLSPNYNKTLTAEPLTEKDNEDKNEKDFHPYDSQKISSKFLDVIDEDEELIDDEIIDEANSAAADPSKKRLEYDDRLFITSDGISKFIKINSILCITAEKDYSYVYLTSGKKSLILKPMIEWETRLTSKYFARIHRSTIVNLEYVEKVEKWFNSSYRVYMQNMHEPFQMSRRYAAKMKERFK